MNKLGNWSIVQSKLIYGITVQYWQIQLHFINCCQNAANDTSSNKQIGL